MQTQKVRNPVSFFTAAEHDIADFTARHLAGLSEISRSLLKA